MGLLNKITDPILKQLKQGVSPHKLAQSVAFGMVLGTLPVVGATTSLCVIAAAVFKLNHVAIQTINYVAYPIQFALLIPYFRLGEWIFGAEPIALDIKMILQEFNVDFMIALKKYAMTALMGTVAWLLISPINYLVLYFSSLKVFQRFVRKPQS
jgi:uncharacterized protein (DUF2062 family)